MVMVFNATFNNISVRSWRSVLLVEETGILGENHVYIFLGIYFGIKGQNIYTNSY